MRLTDFQRRALRALDEAGSGGLDHEDLYPILFPTGRFNTQVDRGSTKGGPSRVQCAVNWHLSKLRPWVRRNMERLSYKGREETFFRNWVITSEGRAALREDCNGSERGPKA